MTFIQNQIIQTIIKSIQTKQRVLETLVPKIEQISEIIITAIKDGKKILICGNGGSAADAQHFSAELAIRYEKNRRALPAIALTTDSSVITASGNDMGFENIFSRQIEALGTEGDVLVAITTSGNSPNVINAVKVAKSKKMKCIVFNGKEGGKLKEELVDIELIIPSKTTSHIQECHEMIYHLISGIVEDHFLEDKQ